MRLATLTGAALAAAVLIVAARERPARGFAEDLTTPGSVERSAVHEDLTRALARCAGFSAADSGVIAEANEATDLGHYQRIHLGFTDRGDVNDPYFHWPQSVGSLPWLEDWAHGRGPLLDETGAPILGCDADGTCCDPDGEATCVYPGSLVSLGIWLHSLADSFSHKACLDAGGVNHADFDPTDGDQLRACPKTAHDAEWGGVDRQLHDNAFEAVRATRDALAAWRDASGLAVCEGGIRDADLRLFVSLRRPERRGILAARLLRACDAACAEVGIGFHPPGP